MGKRLLFGVLLLALAVPAVAQDDEAPKVEFFAGYSFLKADDGGFLSGTGFSNSVPAGFNLDVAFNAGRHLGIVADFQYHKKKFEDATFGLNTDASVLSLHFGPRVKFRGGKAEPFVHGLFGFTHGKASDPSFGEISDNVLSLKLGGGVDVAVAHAFAIRLGEFNYYMTRFDGGPGFESQNNFTFSTGIVFRLGH